MVGSDHDTVWSGTEAMRQQTKITPEMIEAGARVIWLAFTDVMPWGSETARGLAGEVFRAMTQARA